MLSEELDAREAGYRVGYDDQSHFSREYKRHFGEPPIRDVEQLRTLATTSGLHHSRPKAFTVHKKARHNRRARRPRRRAAR